MATTSMLVNESPKDEFPCERGLQQGNPLFSFLFLLIAEIMNVMMIVTIETCFFFLSSGYDVGGTRSLNISHL